MQVVLLGSGNMATVFGKLMLTDGYKIVQVYSRNIDNAAALAGQLQASFTNSLQNIYTEADIYLITVKDDAIKAVADQMHLNGKLIIHMSGAVPMEVLQNVSERIGVIWPMKSINKAVNAIAPSTIFYDANNSADKELIVQMVSKWTTNIEQANDATRLKLHMLAALTSNFSNFLYSLAYNYCEQEKISFAALIPLIEETAKRLEIATPLATQTGPAKRGDIATIISHVKLLESNSATSEVYDFLSKSIMKYYGHEPKF